MAAGTVGASGSAWDTSRLYYSNATGAVPVQGEAGIPETDRVLQRKFLVFLENFRIDAVYPYRESLRRAVSSSKSLLVVELAQLQAFDEHLATELARRPSELMPLFEDAARQLARHLVRMDDDASGAAQSAPDVRDPLADLQIQLNSSTLPTAIRELEAHLIGRLVRIPGIVVSASVVTACPTSVCAACRGCRTERYFTPSPGASGVVLPRTCPGPAGETDVRQQRCPMDPYVLIPERCRCVDQQTLKLQEAPESVPVGELPRQVLVSVDRALVGRISPGSRVVVNGVYSILGAGAGAARKETGGQRTTAVRTPFVRLLGYEALDGTRTGAHGASAASLSESDVAMLARTPGLYERFAESVAPAIFGHADVKRALACLLLGGSRKILPDGIRLRGDINVLLLGDPGVAKSQFLKFVERAAPIAVYTSGKGSSAAGLTASVVRDASSGEFYLEGGAMVLADGGVVCIDEFDKMDAEDRVAIHEAMEQQTISIAKAGITTILNSRTSVLAAANPVFGRYDESRTPGENIDFASTILSRFDMIFVLRDEHSAERDMTLARHVLSVHQSAGAAGSAVPNAGGALPHVGGAPPSIAGGAPPTAGGDASIPLATMRAYIAAAKATCAPRLSAAAADKLSAAYASMRATVHSLERGGGAGGPGGRSAIPITIRQLEAVVRISESLAKMSLAPVATEQHVDEALRLFRVSTMAAVMSGHYSLEGMTPAGVSQEIRDVERVILARLPVGSSTSYRAVVRDLVDTRRFAEPSVVRAIEALVRNETLVFRDQGKLLIHQGRRRF